MRKVILALFLFILLFPSIALGEYVGVGLKWNTETAFAPDMGETCISYGVYNPFDVDVTAKLAADGDLKKLVTRSDEIFVPAHTGSANALPAEICFSPPIRFPPFYPKEYSGTVSAEYASGQQPVGTGSAVGASIQSPLVLKAGNMNMFINFVIAVVLIIIIIILLILRKRIIGFCRVIKIGKKRAELKFAEERLKEIEKEKERLRKKLKGK